MIRALWLLLFSAPAIADSICPVDLSGTQPTMSGYGLPTHNVCYGCRELTRFAIDFNNETWNYIHDGFRGKAVYDRSFGNLKASNTATSSFRLRNISQLGQAANTTLITEFELEHVTQYNVAYCPIPTVERVAILRWIAYTTLYSGESIVSNFIPFQTPPFLPVPATKIDDGFDPARGDCLYNDGDARLLH